MVRVIVVLCNYVHIRFDFQINIEQVHFAYYSQAKRETCSAQNLTKQLQQRSESS